MFSECFYISFYRFCQKLKASLKAFQQLFTHNEGNFWNEQKNIEM